MTALAVPLAAAMMVTAVQAKPAHAASSTLLPPGYLSRTGSTIIDSSGQRVRIDVVTLHGMVDPDQTEIVNQNSPLDGLDASHAQSPQRRGRGG